MNTFAENVAQHLVSFGYSAKPGSITDKKTGDIQPVVFINGLGSINAYLDLSDDPAKFGLKVFGNLQEGYAPVVLDEKGEVIRETIVQNGQRVTRAKRGEPLDAEALKRKNNEISLTARKDITAAVLAAYVLEVAGGDLEKLREGFRLQKWERAAPKNATEVADMGEPTPDASAEFNNAASSAEGVSEEATASQSPRKSKRAQTALKM